MIRLADPVAVADACSSAPRLLMWGIGDTGRAAVQACECAAATAGDHMTPQYARLLAQAGSNPEDPSILYRPARLPGPDPLAGELEQPPQFAHRRPADTVVLVAKACSEVTVRGLIRAAGSLSRSGATLSAVLGLPVQCATGNTTHRIERISRSLRPLLHSLIVVPYAADPPKPGGQAPLNNADSVELVMLRALELLVAAVTDLAHRWDGFASLNQLLGSGMDACVGYGVAESHAALRGRFATQQALAQIQAAGFGPERARIALVHCGRGIAFEAGDRDDIRAQLTKACGPEVRPTLLTDGDRSVRRGFPVTLMTFRRSSLPEALLIA